ncbi:MAG: biotin carboxyl carrier protein [Aeromicrobium sp.]|nr:biotin carboxyl carrier protein [Aeromicrobium sp.]
MNRTSLAINLAIAACLGSVFVAVAGPAATAAERAPSVHASKDRVSFTDPRYDNSATFAVEGTLETVVIDTFGKHAHDQRQYGVRTAAGDLIPIPASFGSRASNGGQFTGRLAITGTLKAKLRDQGVLVRAGHALDASTASGQTAADVASRQMSAVPIASATVAAPSVAAPTPAAHHAYVAVINNRGTVDLSSSQIAAYVGDVTDYWVAQSNGAISSFNTAGTVTYASSAAPSVASACGMLNPNALWSEAAGKFPDVNFGSSGNHLMVLVSNECADAGPAGLGTVGTSIGTGGESIISLTGSRAQVGAHELGHNMSLGHANFQYCPSSCSIDEYLNVHSVMALAVNNFAPPTLDTAYRDLLGITSPGEMADLSLGADDTTETLPEHLSPRSTGLGQRGLRITDPMTGAVYYVDYRSGQGGDSGTYYASSLAASGGFGLDGSGAIARYAPGVVISQVYDGRSTKLLSRKSGNSYFSSYASGQSFTAPGGNLRVTVTSLGGASGADVSVVLTRSLASSTPTIAGTVRVGQSVSVGVGTWAPGVELSYAWRADGVPIPGATDTQYAIGAIDRGKQLSVVVTGVKSGFAAKARTSANHIVGAGVLRSHTPTITGKVRVGSTLTAVPGTWTTGTVLTYHWYVNGTIISGATRSTYTISRARVGKYLTVRVRGAKSGYLAVAKSSSRTSKVTF